MSCFRIKFSSQRVNWFQPQLKSARQHFYPKVSSFGVSLSGKRSVLVGCEILRLFIFYLQMTSILVRMSRISRNQFKCNDLKKYDFFVKISLRFGNIHKIMNILKQRWASQRKCNLLTPKNVVTKMSCFRTPFFSQSVSWTEAPLKSARQHFYPIVSSFWGKFSWKMSLMSLLVGCETLGLCPNRLTTDKKYSRHNRENFPQPIQVQLSKKQKSFSEILNMFMNFT